MPRRMQDTIPRHRSVWVKTFLQVLVFLKPGPGLDWVSPGIKVNVLKYPHVLRSVSIKTYAAPIWRFRL